MGMSVALDQGIIKCISTDTVRAVMRSFVRADISPSLHRSSYSPSGEGDDPVHTWKKSCSVLAASVQGLVDDAIERGQSLVLEGVHIVPSTHLIKRWQKSGGVAIGCLLTIHDAEKHKGQLRKRGFITGNDAAEEKKLKSFDRIRAIQEEMIRLAGEANWLLIEQRLDPDPLEMVGNRLWEDGSVVDIPTVSSQNIDEAISNVTLLGHDFKMVNEETSDVT
jgi:2-phosphoglycerate kinase